MKNLFRIYSNRTLLILILLANQCSTGFSNDSPSLYQQIYKTILPKAEQGDVSAQYNLGLMYQNGQGIPQNDQKAAKWFKLAAEQGHVQAQTNLGWI